MRGHAHMYAGVAGAVLLTLVGTSAMAAEQSTLQVNHINGSEANVHLARAQTPFMAMQGISATPISDTKLAKIAGQGSLANLVRELTKKVGGGKKKQANLRKTVSELTKKVGGGKKKQANLRKTVSELTKKVGGGKKKQANLRKTVSELTKKVGGGKKKQASLRRTVSEVTGKLTRVQRQAISRIGR